MTLKTTESLPSRMKDLPLDRRGYVVPWFVDWIDGEPEFRAMDREKFVMAIRHKLCWVCGGKLGVHFSFVAGPMCGINRTSSEPPSHHECAAWSVRNCPFLANPRAVRREGNLPDNVDVNQAGLPLSRNPGVTMLWNTRVYDVFKPEQTKGSGYLIHMGEPESVEWWREGRPAARAEVLDSIETGLPALENIARLERGGLEALERARRRLDKWLPSDP